MVRFGSPCVDIGQIFGPRPPKIATSWPPPCAPELRFSNRILGFPWFRRFTLKVATLTPRGVQNDPKSHPKRPKSLPKGAQSRPKGTIGGPFGTLERSLAPLWAPNGSSWAVLGTPWGCLGPLRAPLWRLRVTFGSKMVRKSTILTSALDAFRGALGRFSGSSRAECPRIVPGSAARP